MDQSLNKSHVSGMENELLVNCKLNLKKHSNKKIKEKELKDELVRKKSLMEIIKGRFANVKQFLTFVFVGTVNTSLEILTLNFLWWATGLYKGNINYLFKFIALILCSIVGYAMNKKFTFNSKEDNKKAYVKYAVIFAFLSFVEAIMIAEMTKMPVKVIPIYVWANAVSFFASAVTGIANFMISKFIVFKDKN